MVHWNVTRNLWHSRWFLISFVLLVLGLTSVYVTRLPEIYEAEALVMLSDRQTALAFASDVSSSQFNVSRRAAHLEAAAEYEASLAHADPIDREVYQQVAGNSTLTVEDAPVSTFSIDVDTASYANVRRFLGEGRLPPVDAVRTEELINYFGYAYPRPEAPEQPILADLALFDSPWAPGRQLLRVGLQAYQLEPSTRPRVHLVFLVDTSGSMSGPDKLPLLQRSLRLLAQEMRPDDQITIVTYADTAMVALQPTNAREQGKIFDAIDAFFASGRTAGSAGIQVAYRLAEANFDPDAVNRVVLATDGDFNVGISDPTVPTFPANTRRALPNIVGRGWATEGPVRAFPLAAAVNRSAAFPGPVRCLARRGG